MQILVKRHTYTEKSTIGDLFVDGKFICHTLEDCARIYPWISEEEVVEQLKVYGKTAIQAGTYGVILTQSPRFKRLLPELLKVKGLEHIRIHAGNRAENSEGCLLTGDYDPKSPDWVSNGRKNEDKLMAILKTADKIEITIEENKDFGNG